MLTRSVAVGGGGDGGCCYTKRAFRGVGERNFRSRRPEYSAGGVAVVTSRGVPIYIGARRFDRRPLRIHSRTHSRRSAAPCNAGPTLNLALPPSAAPVEGSFRKYYYYFGLVLGKSRTRRSSGGRTSDCICIPGMCMYL